MVVRETRGDDRRLGRLPCVRVSRRTARSRKPTWSPMRPFQIADSAEHLEIGRPEQALRVGVAQELVGPLPVLHHRGLEAGDALVHGLRHP